MDASGFTMLASHFSDRTVVTYDPRGTGRSVRDDGRTDHIPEQQADDLHRIILALGAGPVEIVASSGGAVSALALVAAHPEDVSTLAAHEPPLLTILPDAGSSPGRAARGAERLPGGGASRRGGQVIAMTSWQGEFTDDVATLRQVLADT